MKEKKIFKYLEPKSSSLKINKSYDFVKLYELSINELTLQQSKRDQIIIFYLTLVSFLTPFAYSIEMFNDVFRMVLFGGLSLIGFLLSIIIIRYKVYKEVYWACCQTITQLMNYENNSINKNLIQNIFYKVLMKKDPLRKNSTFKAVRKGFFSAEILIFEIHEILNSAIFFWVLTLLCNHIIYPIIFSTVLFVGVNYLYFKMFFKVFKSTRTNYDEDFNFAFSKAWFLHFYVD